jgi:hypothetical protein
MTTRIRGIGALDRLAEELARAAAMRLGVADSPAELIAAHRLRYRHASEHGTVTAADDAEGMQNDAYDLRALQICAWDGEVLMGTLRLVLPMPGKLLPAEGAFSVTVEPSGEVVDVGSPVIAAELAGERAQRVADGLLAQAWFETRARGYLVMAGLASSRQVGRYRALGIDVQILGRDGGDRSAIRVDPSVG